jgi:hypothetical protein
VFPGLSILAPILLVFLSLQLAAGGDRRTILRAGRIIVGTGAILFAAGHGVMIRLSHPNFGVFGPFLLAFVGYVLIAYCGVLLASRSRLAPLTAEGQNH